jgi:hypothetical protein
MASLDKHPCARDRKHDGLGSHPIHRCQHVVLLRPAACGLVQYANEVQHRDSVSLDIALDITAAAGDQASRRAWASRIDCNDVTF